MTKPINIDKRRELFVDDFLIEHMDGVELCLHRPAAAEVALVHDAPWEGNVCFYHTVIEDEDRYRMYYRGAHYSENDQEIHRQVVCYAESDDGIHWVRPELGLFEFDGSKNNNIVWDGLGTHNFAPFKDANPQCDPAARYKALASKGMEGLYAFQSADGIHWSLMQEEAVITDGKFDSQNLAFYDVLRGCYVEFHRDTQQHNGEGVRAIKTGVSDDFLHWSQAQFLTYTDVPVEHLYTNQITPYPRAPHIYMGFPKRFVPKRSTVVHQYDGVSDVVFMSSRDGVNFNRWGEAFIAPGPQPERWVNRNNFVACNIVQTASGLEHTPDLLTFYSMEGYYRGESCQMRRYTLRQDGFVSVHAPRSGGQFISRPLVVSGAGLALNFATSAAGTIGLELQDLEGRAIPGFSLEECDEHFGDALDRTITWGQNGDLSSLAGQAVRIRWILDDADIYALRFI
ncbi:MAG: hypothetical protein GKR89_14490 [Candidatus Latescibacteria bacterium]|nr:hypothetical protein [Candidatus Latescibacterota bacterium]